MPGNIRAVIFDLGGVLVGFKGQAFLQETLSFVPMANIVEWNNSTAELQRLFELGLLQEQEFFEKLQPLMKKKLSFQQFCKKWSDFFTFRPKVFGLLAKLKAAGYKIGILSNTNALHWSWIKKHYNFDSAVDAVVTSFECHCLKPDKKIFNSVLAGLQEKPENCIYIDDLPKYVDAARALGFNAIQYKSLSQMKKELSEFGVLK